MVVGNDNLSTGMPEFIASASRHRNFAFLRGDLLDTRGLTEAMRGATRVVHLAANADVRFGPHPHRDLEQNTIATFNVLEAMRANDVKEIAFASTGSIYGEATIVPTPEDAPFPVQNTSRIRGLGWKPKKSIREAVELTVDWLDANRWVFAKRH